ncbi:MAG TPA: hypothetical protein VIQ02_09710, partial [Jiangellaceae bacterium]
VAGAVMIIAGSFLQYIWDSPITDYLTAGWYAYAFVVAVLVGSASLYALRAGAWTLISAGILLGTVAASTWGLAVPISQQGDGGFEVGFWFELVGHLFLVLAASLCVLALRRRRDVRLVPRALRGVPAWLVALLGVGGALALQINNVMHTYDFGSPVPPVFLSVMALVVPASAAVAVPRRFGVALLAGWIAAAASVFVAYTVLVEYYYGSDITGPIVAFGVTLLGLAVVAVPFARGAQNSQPRAEGGV